MKNNFSNPGEGKGPLITQGITWKGESQRSILKKSFKHCSGEYELWAINYFKNFFPLAKSCVGWRQMQGLVLSSFHQQELFYHIWCLSEMAQSHTIYVILLVLIPNNMYYLYFHAFMPTKRKCFCHTDHDTLVPEILVLTVHE